MSSVRVNAFGLSEAIDELVGGDPRGQHLPIAFRIPGGPVQMNEVGFYFRISIEMVTDDGTQKPFRAIVITPDRS